MKDQENILRQRSAQITKDLANGKDITLLSGQVMPVKDYLIMMRKPSYKPTYLLSPAEKGYYDPETKPTSSELDGFPSDSCKAL